MTHIERAARVDDGVAHQGESGISFGFNLASLAAAAIIIGSGGTAAVAVLVVQVGSTTGAFLEAIHNPDTQIEEKIVQGAKTVFMDDRFRAAMAFKDCTVSDHPDAWVCTGSATVFTEGFNASRRLDVTTCSGIVATGSDTIIIGGDPALAPSAPNKEALRKLLESGEPGEGPTAAHVRAVSFLAGAVGLMSAPKSAWEAITWAGGAASLVAEPPTAIDAVLQMDAARGLPDSVAEILKAMKR